MADVRGMRGFTSKPLHRQRGQSMTEYLIILPSLLLLVLGVIQFALIYQAKASLNYATFMGARQGALNNAKITSIIGGVVGGMTPFFMRTSNAPFLDDMAKARMIAAIEVSNPNTAKVEIISPTAVAFDAYSQLSNTGDIPNDNLMFRDSSVLKDGMSIQDANLLKIRVTYCVKLMVPFVDRVIYALSTGIASVKNMTQESYWVSSTETIPNICSVMNGSYASARQQVNALTGAMPAGVSLTDSGLTDSDIKQLSQQFPTTPVLNWNVGGMRIPITAEAIVRMQSPVRF
ncbi:MAG: hypothetical protein HHJ17_09080 [Rhodoferax sp.]|uniref:TadE/TadG family type IV pilus assembly protein n=1 Tax=Rhodoferax sp. TaxID=50421 RepID=UPI001841DAA2|nr:TadE/TadG family type IV pilus assembly protein [Rhodoferax sp.]NMM13675.1 hypothetical protein [Rhodoferax sp.]NMM20508.1 hypothetical protein [Rhodoferax sp.]